MKTKNIVIIIIAVLLIAAIGGFILFNNNQLKVSEKQSPISLTKSAIIKVPKDPNATHNASKKGVFYYKSGDNLNITVCSNMSKPSGASELKNTINSIEKGSKKLKDNDVIMFLKDGIYSAYIKNSQYNDTILIQSPSKDILLQCWDNIRFHDPSDKFKFNDTEDTSASDVIDAVEQTEKAVGTSYTSTTSSSESYSSSSDSSSDSYTGYADYSSSGGRSSGGSSGGGSGGSGGGSGTPGWRNF